MLETQCLFSVLPRSLFPSLLSLHPSSSYRFRIVRRSTSELPPLPPPEDWKRAPRDHEEGVEGALLMEPSPLPARDIVDAAAAFAFAAAVLAVRVAMQTVPGCRGTSGGMKNGAGREVSHLSFSPCRGKR